MLGLKMGDLSAGPAVPLTHHVTLASASEGAADSDVCAVLALIELNLHRTSPLRRLHFLKAGCH